MSFFRTLARATVLWAQDNAIDILSVVVLPVTGRAAARVFGRTLTPWVTRNVWNVKTVDGAVLGGVSPTGSGAKYALPKGLPKPGLRSLVIENEPHVADGFSGVISSGYGKGTKTLLADETVAVKIGTKMFLSRMNYHFHEADVAGPHYDIVVADVPPGTEQFEINIPRGEYKGRYAFVTTAKGKLCIPMTEEGALLSKPEYKLRPEAALAGLDLSQYEVSRKMDGSLGNVKITKNRGIFRSHRETASPYFDKLPQLERLYNESPVWTYRKILPGPNQEGTVLQGELVHPDGASRVAGILNALPVNAQAIQQTRGPVEFYAWDIARYRSRDLSSLPYGERRRILETVVTDIRQVNRHWHMVERMPEGMDPAVYYNHVLSDPRGLPWSEGIVLKALQGTGETWVKIKRKDFRDLVITGTTEGEGRLTDSLGTLIVRDPLTGKTGEVGTGFTDLEREWIYRNRESLNGAVVKVGMMAETENSFRAPVFHGFHPDPRFGGAGVERGLTLYAESLAGGNEEESKRMLYRLKSAAGWKR